MIIAICIFAALWIGWVGWLFGSWLMPEREDCTLCPDLYPEPTPDHEPKQINGGAGAAGPDA